MNIRKQSSLQVKQQFVFPVETEGNLKIFHSINKKKCICTQVLQLRFHSDAWNVVGSEVNGCLFGVFGERMWGNKHVGQKVLVLRQVYDVRGLSSSDICFLCLFTSSDRLFVYEFTSVVCLQVQIGCLFTSSDLFPAAAARTSFTQTNVTQRTGMALFYFNPVEKRGPDFHFVSSSMETISEQINTFCLYRIFDI